MEIGVFKSIHVIEELKIELLQAHCHFQTGAVHSSETEILQGLADMIGLSYLLARRMGLDFSKVDRMLMQRLEVWRTAEKTNLEKWWGDLSMLQSYLAPDE
ncbi:MAG: MazG-like family protein [Peptococcaceae bacterium]|nr:MazG-like family protein [Peptococcaceae bacterium]